MFRIIITFCIRCFFVIATVSIIRFVLILLSILVVLSFFDFYFKHCYCYRLLSYAFAFFFVGMLLSSLLLLFVFPFLFFIFVVFVVSLSSSSSSSSPSPSSSSVCPSLSSSSLSSSHYVYYQHQMYSSFVFSMVFTCGLFPLSYSHIVVCKYVTWLLWGILVFCFFPLLFLLRMFLLDVLTICVRLVLGVSPCHLHMDSLIRCCLRLRCAIICLHPTHIMFLSLCCLSFSSLLVIVRAFHICMFPPLLRDSINLVFRRRCSLVASSSRSSSSSSSTSSHYFYCFSLPSSYYSFSL